MKTLTIAGLLFCCLSSGISAEEYDSDKISTIFNELQSVRENQDLIVDEMRSTIAKQQSTIQELTEQVETQQGTIQVLTARMTSLEETRLNPAYPPTVKNQHQSFGCLSDVLAMSCPAGQLINLTRAYYGMYADSCSDCCPPHPTDDCTELVSEYAPADWAALDYLCNNQQSCSYEYQGSTVDSCAEAYIADYMQIFYDCLLYKDNAPVGFSAYATTYRQYDSGDVVLFDAIISNIGNHYNSDTSSFTCPYNGMYLFSVNYNAYGNYEMNAEIMRDNEGLVQAWADNNSYSQAAGLVVTECSIGQVVWVRGAYNGDYMYGNSRRSSHFSGALLYRYP